MAQAIRDSIDDVLSDEDPSQLLWPMPYIDGKPPYGNRSYYQIDMAELLGQPFAKNAQGIYILSPDKDQALASLHQQTQAALQVGVHVRDTRHSQPRLGPSSA